MNLDQFLDRPTALLFASDPEIQSPDWHFVDGDAFLDSLSLWGNPNRPIEELFSVALPGIRQNLADTANSHVGLYGRWLVGEALDRVANEYAHRGYNVFAFDEAGKQKMVVPAKSTQCRIFFSSIHSTK